MAQGQLVQGNKFGRWVHTLMQNYAILYAFLLVVERIFLLKFLEDSGMGYLALPMDLFLMALFGITLPFTRTVSGLMKLYIRRSQMKNAWKIGNIGFGVSVILAFFSALFVLLFSQKIAGFFHVPLSWMIILFSAVAILFSILGGGAKSFIAGVSADLFLYIGNVMEVVLILVGSFLGASLGHNQGLKVMSLLRFSELQYVYTGAGVMAGIALAQIVTGVYWCVIFVISRHALIGSLKDDQTRRTDENRTMLLRIANNILPTSLLALFSQCIVLLGQWLYLRYIPEGETAEKMVAYWGCFYGKYLPFVMIPILICIVTMTKSYKRIVSAYDNEDVRQLREHIEKTLIVLNSITFTGAVLIAVLAQPFLEAICGGMVTTVLKVMQTTSIVVVAYGYYYCCHNLLQRMQFYGDSLIIGVISFVATLVLSVLLFSRSAQNLIIPAFILVLYFGIAGILVFLRLQSRFRCKVNLIRTYAYPLFCSCVSGLVVMFLGKGFGQLMGSMIALILGILIGLFVEIFTLLVLHVINENQASRIPLGKLVCYIAGVIGFR